jgi:mannonate dehydratase
MRLSMIVTPFSGENLQLAAQVGVEEIVAVYPGPGQDPLRKVKREVERYGMRLTHIERKLPHDQIVHGLAGRDNQVAMIKGLLRDMAEVGLEVLCYNWMPSEDWCRTTSLNPERGGSCSTAFSVDAEVGNVTDADGSPEVATPASRLWENLESFLDEVLPVAEEAGIKLALHPDDPPLKNFWGQEQIMISIDALERVTKLAPSPSNGVCFCTGSLGPTGEDLIGGIRRLADRIHFVHLRNTRGRAEDFQETWPDNGESDLPGVMRALHEAGYRGTIRPDHAPSMAGESNATPGYEMKGRLFAAGYLRGLMQACEGKGSRP